MRRWPTFADLPVELSERIILLAARSYALDKAWLAQLTRASRAIHALVQPILVETIVITSSNLSRLYSESSTYTSTRCLMVDDEIEDDTLLRAFLLSTPGLHSVDMFRGPMWALDALLKVSRPTRVIITSALWRGGGWSAARDNLSLHLSQMTHIRAALSTIYSLLAIPEALLSTTHVVVDRFQGDPASEVIDQNLPILLRGLIRNLALDRLQRLCIAVDHDDIERISALLAFAREHRETRLWINPVPMDGDPYSEFEDERWTGGQQLYRE